MKIAVLIPAYRPDHRLLELLRALSAADFCDVVVVDDGSGAEYSAIFEAACATPKVHVLAHPENRGKGDALKTGLKFVRDRLPQCEGVITADSDGQHHASDVIKVAARLASEPGTLVLGARLFEGPVPLRSRLGNTLTRFALRWIGGAKLTDTQTGLRGIPRVLISGLLEISSTGYEFELDMLLLAKHGSFPIVEEPISTIYIEGNRGSHFNPLLDSLKIWFVLLRFSLVSLVTAALDNTVFFLAFQAGAGVLLAQVTGRMLAVIFNYRAVRGAVFHSHRQHRVALPRYLALVVASGTVSYFLIGAMVEHLRIPVLLAKIYAEAGLFLLNFVVQRDLIFARRRADAPATGWNAYYFSTPFTARLTRRYTGSVLVRLMKRYAAGRGGCLVELGGANSCFLDRIASEMAPRAYHVIDTNEFGLELLSRRAVNGSRLVLHHGDVRDRPPHIRADLVFSVGLIEHFDPENTARAVDAHFELLKPGGWAILSFPTPTRLYRGARFLAETAGLWNFPDERPLEREEVAAVVARHAEILHEEVMWPLVFTQRIIVARKKGAPPSGQPAEASRRESETVLARLFLCFGILLGVPYALLMPPNQVPDEWAHFLRSWEVSTGKLIATPESIPPPGFGPIWQRFTPALDIIDPPRRWIHKEDWLGVLHSDGGPVYTGPVLRNTGGNLYCFVPYVPAGVALAAARAVGFPMLVIYYTGRFTNLAVYVFLIWLALRRAPRFHLLFFALALMPMSLHQAASFSEDGISIAVTFLFIAVVLDLAYSSPIRLLGRRDYLQLAALVVALSLIKFNIWLVLMLALIPVQRFKSAKARVAFLLCFLALACGMAGWWQEVNRANIQAYSQTPPVRDVYPADSGRLAWQHPWWFIESVARSMRKNGAFFRQSFVGSLAHLSIPLPVWLVNLYLLLLAAVAITESPPAGFDGRARWICAAVVLGTTVSLFALLLILNTPRSETAHWAQGQGVITGIQGRYFIPFAPLALALLASRRLRLNRGVMLALSTSAIVIATGTAWLRIYDTFWNQP